MTGRAEPAPAGLPAVAMRLLSAARLAKLARFAGAQVVVQALGLVAGLMLVRAMAQTDYGHYTLAMSMVGLANVLLGLGLPGAVLTHGGPLHADKAPLSRLVADALVLQRWLAWGGALLLLPGFAAMFVHQGVMTADVVALTLLVLGTSVLNVFSAIAMSVVRIKADTRTQQRLEIAVNLGKLLFVAGAVLIYLDARVAVVVNLGAAAAVYVLLQRQIGRHLDPAVVSSGERRSDLLDYVRRQAPNSIYYCLSGQAAVWVVGILGPVQSVAEVGALGRLAMLFVVLGAIVAGLVQPYFARATDRQAVVAGFGVVNGLFAALTALLVAGALAWPQLLLWILGPNYGHLETELVWMVLGSALGAWSGAVYAIGAARNVIVPAAWVIPVGLGAIVVSAWQLDVSQVSGSLQMTAASAGCILVLTLAFVGRRLAAGARAARGSA
jgi:O-antigen/teichoic acid export membrane protein